MSILRREIFFYPHIQILITYLWKREKDGSITLTIPYKKEQINASMADAIRYKILRTKEIAEEICPDPPIRAMRDQDMWCDDRDILVIRSTDWIDENEERPNFDHLPELSTDNAGSDRADPHPNDEQYSELEALVAEVSEGQ